MEATVLKLYPSSETSPLPRWDARHRCLWYGDVLVKRLERAAPGQEAILTAFEKEQWPEEVVNPFSGDEVTTALQYLENAVKGLNRRQKNALLRFSLMPDRSSVSWKAVQTGEPSAYWVQPG